MDPDLVRQQRDEELSFKAAYNGVKRLCPNGGAAADRPASAEQGAAETLNEMHRAAADAPQPHAHAPSGRVSVWSSARIALDGLIGCVIGSFAGDALGSRLLHTFWQGDVAVGHAHLFIWGAIGGMFFAALLGFALPAATLIRRENLSFPRALRVIWPGAFILIGVLWGAPAGMDFLLSQTGRLAWPIHGLAAAAGFLAAWPINHACLKRELTRRR